MSVFLEHVLCSISDYLPLHAIVTRLMGSCGAERFGGLRSTLLSLFSACDYEQTIMGSANRLVTRDVFGVVRAGFRLRTGECAHVTVEAAGEGEDEAGTGLDAGSFRVSGAILVGGCGRVELGKPAATSLKLVAHTLNSRTICHKGLTKDARVCVLYGGCGARERGRVASSTGKYVSPVRFPEQFDCVR